MKYVFFGSPRFAAIILQKLIDAGMPPVALVCNPDRPAGRKQIVTPPPTKLIALAQAEPIPVLQPEAFDHTLAENLRVLAPDILVVAAYAKIIPSAVLEIPRVGTLGAHPSLLPKYRGSSPIQTAILNGETETGTTIYLMDAKMDHGPILAAERLSLKGDEQYEAVEKKLAGLSGTLLISAMPNYVAGILTPKPQDESGATYTKKFATEDGFIDEKDLAAAAHGNMDTARSILQKINALNPEPGAWTASGDKRVKLLEATIENGRLVLLTIQNEGEKPKTPTGNS